MGNDNTTTIWPWDDAPSVLQELSQHGGDEDWIVMLPDDPNNWPPYFANRQDESYVDGWGHAGWHKYNGAHILIFAHA